MNIHYYAVLIRCLHWGQGAKLLLKFSLYPSTSPVAGSVLTETYLPVCLVNKPQGHVHVTKQAWGLDLFCIQISHTLVFVFIF